MDELYHCDFSVSSSRHELSRAYLTVEHGVRCLHQACVAIQEDGAEQPDLLYSIRLLLHSHPIADVVGVLDEQEDDTREDLGQTASNQPAQTYPRSHKRRMSCAQGTEWQRRTHQVRVFPHWSPAWQLVLPGG